MSAFKLLEFGVDLGKLAKCLHVLTDELETEEDLALLNA